MDEASVGKSVVDDESNALPQNLRGDVCEAIGKDEVSSEEFQVFNVGDSQPQTESSAGDPAEPSATLACRICLTNTTNARGDKLISPCYCRGTLGFVHRNCLERWIDESGNTECELCRFAYKTSSVLRYTLIESLRIWYRHPLNRRLLFTDLLLCVLLTIIGFGMTLICVVALHYFISNAETHENFPRTWTVGSMIVFLIIVVLSYVLNIFLVVRSQILSWYRWWHNNRRVKLLME